MRITGGALRGHRLDVAGRDDLRPSQDRVREAIFNILGDIQDTRVLDLYAGTGALGVEALSRGARYCDFVEKDATSTLQIKKNLEKLELLEQSDIYTDRVEAFVGQPRSQLFDLVFLDPPYHFDSSTVISALPNVLARHGIAIYLHGKKSPKLKPQDEQTPPIETFDTRKYGDTIVEYIRLVSHDPNPTV